MTNGPCPPVNPHVFKVKVSDVRNSRYQNLYSECFCQGHTENKKGVPVLKHEQCRKQRPRLKAYLLVCAVSAHVSMDEMPSSSIPLYAVVFLCLLDVLKNRSNNTTGRLVA